MRPRHTAKTRAKTGGRTPTRVVGIGASAGGLDAFKKLLPGLPAGTGMAFVLLPHADPHQKGGLAAAVSSVTGMKVVEIGDRADLRRDTIYVLPPGRSLAVAGRRLVSGPLPEGAKGRLIDFFFVSLARALRSEAVGVVLSGFGTDGAQGLAAIRTEGGITIAQDPKSAAAAAMPAAAVGAGAADFVLTPARIAEELAAIGRAAASRGERRTDGRPAGTEGALKAILKRVKASTGVDFSHYKRSTLVRRLQRRMAIRRVEDLAAYAAFLERSPAEVEALREEVLIHVTAFFREPEAFEALRKTVFPALTRGRPAGVPIRLWVPGCSTGEEVYSLAIALQEHMGREGRSFPIQIFGTDISEAVVAFARQGKYIEPAVSVEQRRRHFERTRDGQYQVVKALRELCVFAAHDLTRDPPYSNLDLISCRNVLIYFDQALQDKVIPVFHYALAQPGFLMLGPSESIDAFGHLFSPVEKTHRIFSRRAASSRLPSDFLSPGRAAVLPPQEKPEDEPERWSAADLAKEADRIVLSASAPGVIVSENLDVLQFRGDLSAFLTPSPGKASYNLAKMAHEGLLFSAARAVEEAKARRVPIVIRRVGVKRRGATRTVQLQVVPLPAAQGPASHFLIQFADPAAPPPAGAETLEDAQPQTRERYLERELQATRQTLESIIEKQQTTNEELQSANEELRSRNEEYQSSLEELQTTHEELQSANEEMATLNEELRHRTAELDAKNEALARANEDMRAAATLRARLAAIVESSDDAIVAKDLNGVITDWNRGAEALFGYTAAEAVGNPILMLIPPDRLDEEPAILEKIRRGERISHFETVRRRKDGRLIDVSVSISPIKDANGAIVGASKIARDVTERKRSRERLEKTVAERTIELRATNQELEAFCYAVAHDLRAPLRSVRSFAQLVERRLPTAEESVRRDFQRILDNTARMSELIDGLLNLSRLTRQEVKSELVDLSAEVEAIIRELRSAEPGRAVETRVQPGLRVSGDRNLLRALLFNLLENSWKFTSKHAAARVEFGAELRDGRLVYHLKDDGAGFDPAHAKELFSAFHRLHHPSEFPGTGIGLATAKRIVYRHGGKIWAEGAVEKGATFYFTIDSPDASAGEEKAS